MSLSSLECTSDWHLQEPVTRRKLFADAGRAMVGLGVASTSVGVAVKFGGNIARFGKDIFRETQLPDERDFSPFTTDEVMWLRGEHAASEIGISYRELPSQHERGIRRVIFDVPKVDYGPQGLTSVNLTLVTRDAQETHYIPLDGVLDDNEQWRYLLPMVYENGRAQEETHQLGKLPAGKTVEFEVRSIQGEDEKLADGQFDIWLSYPSKQTTLQIFHESCFVLVTRPDNLLHPANDGPFTAYVIPYRGEYKGEDCWFGVYEEWFTHEDSREEEDLFAHTGRNDDREGVSKVLIPVEIGKPRNLQIQFPYHNWYKAEGYMVDGTRPLVLISSQNNNFSMLLYPIFSGYVYSPRPRVVSEEVYNLLRGRREEVVQGISVHEMIQQGRVDPNDQNLSPAFREMLKEYNHN